MEDIPRSHPFVVTEICEAKRVSSTELISLFFVILWFLFFGYYYYIFVLFLLSKIVLQILIYEIR